MAENMIKFLRGNAASLPQVSTAGAVYFTKDEGLYLGLDDGTYHRYGDFIEVADVASLPATGAHVKAMYYCTAENILAKWNGSKWVQINKQQTLAELGGVAQSVYEAKMAALEKAYTDNANAISGVESRLQTAEDKLKSVATTEGLGELYDTVDEHTTAIDTINGDVNTTGSMLKIAKDAADGKDLAIKEAKDAADNAQKDVDALTQTYTTDKAVLDAAIALKANAADVYTQAVIDGKIDTINAAIANKADADNVYTKGEVDDMIDNVKSTMYDDEEVRGLIDTNTEAIAKEIEDREGAISDLRDELAGNLSTKVEQSVYDAQIQELVDEDTELAGLINGNAADIEELGIEIDTLVGTDTGKSVRTIANEELAAQLIAENAADALDSLYEIAAWIQEHPNDASAMHAAIEALQGMVDTDDQTVSQYIATVIGDLNIDDYATVVALNEAIERITTLETDSATHATKEELSVVADELDTYKTLHNGDYDNTVIDAKVKDVQDQIDALGNIYATDSELTSAINAEVERANGVYATQSDVTTHVANADVHVTTEDKAKWNAAEQNAKDYSNDQIGVAKTELQGYADQAELDAVAAAKTETENQVAAEAIIARAAEQANATAISNEATARQQAVSEVQGAVDTVSDALDTYKTENDTAVAQKANAADVYSKAEIEAMLTWSDF